MTFKKMKKYITPSDFLRWVLTVIFLYFIFTKTVFIVGLFAVLVTIRMELDTIQGRTRDKLIELMVEELDMIMERETTIIAPKQHPKS